MKLINFLILACVLLSTSAMSQSTFNANRQNVSTDNLTPAQINLIRQSVITGKPLNSNEFNAAGQSTKAQSAESAIIGLRCESSQLNEPLMITIFKDERMVKLGNGLSDNFPYLEDWSGVIKWTQKGGSIGNLGLGYYQLDRNSGVLRATLVLNRPDSSAMTFVYNCSRKPEQLF